MPHFSTSFLDFFEHLEGHNSKERFDENRSWYHSDVKDPFDAFLRDLIAEVQKDDPDIMIEPKHAKFRINRDIRFSKDKTPYKTHVSAVISREGRKDMTTPGLYIQLGNSGLEFACGSYRPDKFQLKQIRTALIKHRKKVDKILGDKTLSSIFGKLQGEKNKRLPKEFQEPALSQPLIFNKQFYFYTKYPKKKILSPKLLNFCMEHRHAAKERNTFLRKAFATIPKEKNE